jgi:hypothetical protein
MIQGFLIYIKSKGIYQQENLMSNGSSRAYHTVKLLESGEYAPPTNLWKNDWVNLKISVAYVYNICSICLHKSDFCL